ncbi:unnamed protein product [Rhodiola kirilowii]
MKLDMSKAYDRVSWLFLLRMMRALGFNAKWCDLVYCTISSYYYLVLWDGSAYGRFKSNRGVRQGDPLSPSLFLICMESFSRLLQHHTSAGTIQSYFTKVGALQISHLLYADDILLFTNGSKRSIERLMSMVNSFCNWTGQALNNSKSSIFLPQDISTARRRTLLQTTGFTEGRFPTTYLGAPLFPGRVKIEYFQRLEDQSRARITGWMRNMLSLGGKITLVESVLNSMAAHVLACLSTPTAVIDRISSLLSNFIWDSGGQSRHHWVSWSDICREKQAGGLGIRHLDAIRTGFQYKLAWQSMDPNSLWGRFVHSRYKEGQQGSHIWTYVSKALAGFRMQCSWNIGKGELTVADFCWIYQATPPQDLMHLPMHVVMNDPPSLTKLTLVLPLRGRQDLQATNISNLPDNLSWHRSAFGHFSTQAFRAVCNTPRPRDKILSSVWQAWIPPKISAFVWRLKHRAVPTDDQIRSCGIYLASSCRCCQMPREEIAAHLFILGDEATKIWERGKTLLDLPIPRTFT